LSYIVFQRKKIKEALHIDSILADKLSRNLESIKEYIYAHITIKNKIKYSINLLKLGTFFAVKGFR
jgi:hypothetical protein